MTDYIPPEQPGPVQAGPYYPAAMRQRPLGVTILAVLEVLGGLLFLLVALASFLLAFVLNISDFQQRYGVDIPQEILNLGSAFFAVVGVVLIIIAILSFILAWGFLKGKRWAWLLGVVLSVLEIIGGAVSIFSASPSVLGLIIAVIVLVYLFLPSTKAWFTQ
jgi:hypothetical protein